MQKLPPALEVDPRVSGSRTHTVADDGLALERAGMHTALALALPFLLCCLLFKDYQALSLDRDRLIPLLFSLFLPQLGLFLVLISLTASVITRAGQRARALAFGSLLVTLTLHTLITGLDTLSCEMRQIPVHWLEMRAFMAHPEQLWPVAASALPAGGWTGPVVLVVVLCPLLLVAAWKVCRPLWGVASARVPGQTSGGASPVHRHRHQKELLALFVGGLGLCTLPLPAAEDERPFQRLPIERMARGIWLELEELDSVHVSALETPLRIDRNQARTPFNLIVFVLESTPYKATSLAKKASEDSAQGPTPFLATLAQQGLEVPNTYTVLTHTSKALVGILCGQMPYPEMEAIEGEGVIPNRCLPEVLAEGGYQTGFFQAPDLEFEERHAMARYMGFGTVRGGKELDTTGFELVNYFGHEDRIVLEPAVSWVKDTPGPYMLTIMTGTSHHPYGSPGNPPISGAGTPELIQERYRQSLQYVDGTLKALLEQVEAARGLENTLVMVVGDHGEAFGEHGLVHHNWVPYEEGVRVPLVLWGPDVLTPARAGKALPPGTQLTGLRQQTDLMPTVLDLLGWKTTAGTLPGKSLVSSPGHASVYFSCLSASMCMGMRSGNLKYIQAFERGSLQVFDLEKDPDERHNLANQQPTSRLETVEFNLWNHKLTVKSRYLAHDRNRKRSDEQGSPWLARWEGGE